jgi:ABC-type glycerol-3-phosphate transport system substrate-binding protein
MKKLFKILVTLLVAMSVVACSGGGNGGGGEASGEPVDVVFWHTLTDHDEEMVQEIVEKFNASQDKYNVIQLTQPLDGFEAKVYEAVTNGTGPSLVWLYPGTATEYVDEGFSLDFGQYLTDDEYKNRVSDGVYAASTDYSDGKLHALVCTLTGSIMFYNKELLEKYNLEIPQTWDDLYNACKTVVDGEKAEGNDIMGFGPDSVDVVGIDVLYQLGKAYIDDNNTANDWTDPQFVEWIDWWKKAEAEGYFQLVDPEGYHSGPFGNQQYFCYMGSSAGMNYITPNGFTIVTGPVPQIEGGRMYNELTARALVGFAKDETVDAGAAAFASFFTQAENNLPFCQKYSASTPFKDVETSDVYKEYFNGSVAQQAFASMLDYMYARKAVTGQTACKEAIIQALKTAIVSGEDTLTALQTAQAQANAALSE